MNADTKLVEIKGIGKKTFEIFQKKGLETAGDLLKYYPRNYEYYDDPVRTSEVPAAGICAITLTIVGNGSTVRAGAYTITRFHAADAAGRIELRYFNSPFLVKTLRAGSVHVFRGQVKHYQNGKLYMEQPVSYTPAEYEQLRGRWRPVYPLTRDLSGKVIIRTLQEIIESIPPQEDYIPEKDRQELGLYPLWDAVVKIHFPASREDIRQSRRRLIFDEFFEYIALSRQQKLSSLKIRNERPLLKTAATGRLIEQLPYDLTPSQKKVFQEIEDDLSGPYVMNRLLQGDVGSGKTILAFLAMIMCAENNRQAALMAPTEVLAQQHMEKFTAMVRRYHLPYHPVLLTGSVKGKDRKQAYQEIADGTADIIIGTHALIQEKLTYKDLSLVITDEQHRFGVRQRESLAGKGGCIPVLVMSATPIPRTLSIILYGDLSVSRLTDLPANRLPIKKLVMSSADRGKAVAFMLREIAKGRQAYIICPAVEESEGMDLENVTDYEKKLRSCVPENIRIAKLHGRMRPADKERIMNEFAAHETDILISTTVIEVGIDVPNATVIIIENAERFGLSQLHQLRGRVGRGSGQSYCIFLYSADLPQKPKRLEILEQSNDGFYIAEQDLKLRGPGDVFGVRQSGEFGFVLGDVIGDADIMMEASRYADKVLTEHPERIPAGSKSVDFRSI